VAWPVELRGTSEQHVVGCTFSREKTMAGPAKKAAVAKKNVAKRNAAKRNAAKRNVSIARTTANPFQSGLTGKNYVSFARLSTIRDAGDILVAEWSDSFTEACQPSNLSYINKNAIISRDELNPCGRDGDPIIKLEHY
jgi:hypothetical protein